MKKYFLFPVLGALIVVWLNTADAADEGITVVMVEEQATNAYYVDVHFQGMEAMHFLVDTGSSYTVINHDTLAALKENGLARFVKELMGIMADDTRKVVPVYRLARVNIGAKCTLYNVEAAIFPGKVRQILGLSALRKAAPFVFSTSPPSLALNNCQNSQVLTAGAN